MKSFLSRECAKFDSISCKGKISWVESMKIIERLKADGLSIGEFTALCSQHLKVYTRKWETTCCICSSKSGRLAKISTTLAQAHGFSSLRYIHHNCAKQLRQQQIKQKEGLEEKLEERNQEIEQLKKFNDYQFLLVEEQKKLKIQAQTRFRVAKKRHLEQREEEREMSEQQMDKIIVNDLRNYTTYRSARSYLRHKIEQITEHKEVRKSQVKQLFNIKAPTNKSAVIDLKEYMPYILQRYSHRLELGTHITVRIGIDGVKVGVKACVTCIGATLPFLEADAMKQVSHK
jgi:hypothetical protein